MKKHYLLHDDYVYSDLDTALEFAIDGDDIDSSVAGIVTIDSATGEVVVYKGQELADMVAAQVRDNEEQRAYNNELSSSKIGGVL